MPVSRTTFTKRQKERARQERQSEKAQKKAERKAQKSEEPVTSANPDGPVLRYTEEGTLAELDFHDFA
ncbi:MAG: hypothetical protein JOZ43_01480 [Acidobacteriales bacterium]|nr:hypothetical protein [Terriglobales bacterium]